MKVAQLFIPGFVLVLWLSAAIAVAQPIERPVTHLKVGFLDIPPFGYHHGEKISGIAVDIWNQIAKDNHFDSQFVDIGQDFDAAVQKIQDGELDVTIGPIGLRSQTEKLGYFTLPYYHDHFVIIAKERSFSIWSRFNAIFKGHSGYAIAALLILYVLYLNTFLFVERRYQPELINLNYRDAIEEVAWRSLLGHIRSAPYYPATRVMRVVTIVWSIICTIYLFSILAGLTASLFSIYATAGKDIIQLSDVGAKPIAVYGGRNTLSSAKSIGFNVTAHPKTMNEAVLLLDKGDVVGIYTFKLFGTTYLRTIKRTDLYVSPISLPMASVGFFFNDSKASLLRGVNVGILKMTADGIKSRICAKYEGSDPGEHCA